jgi:hypothetical protein
MLDQVIKHTFIELGLKPSNQEDCSDVEIEDIFS